MNITAHTDTMSPPPATQQTQTRIGAGTFLISRRFVGDCPVCDLLRQRVQRAAHTTSSIDETSGTAV